MPCLTWQPMIAMPCAKGSNTHHQVLLFIWHATIDIRYHQRKKEKKDSVSTGRNVSGISSSHKKETFTYNKQRTEAIVEVEITVG